MFIYKNKQINDRNAFNIDIKLFICLFSKILKALLILSLYQKEDNLEFNQRHNQKLLIYYFEKNYTYMYDISLVGKGGGR